MRRRPGTTGLAAGVVAAGIVAAVGVTTLSGPAVVPASSGQAVLTSALRQDLSPAADQARLRRQAWAGGAEQELRERLGTEFAGAWMSRDGGELMVGVTTGAAAQAVRAAGAIPKMLPRNESELVVLKKRLDARPADPAVTGWYVDPASNQVVLVARPGAGAEARKLAADRGVPAAAVRVVTSGRAPRLFFDVRGGDAYFIDRQFRCSVGFAVEGGFVTAGHCGEAGSTTTGFNQAAQGTVRASVFPGSGDHGFVEVDGDWTPQPVVATSDGPVEVAGSQEAPVGAAVCRSGSTTGTRCGVIQAKNATVNYPEGAVTGLTQTNVCAEGGDSGGPWLSGDQAQGVTSGGSGDCTRGGTTFFQPVNEILDANNLRLVTTQDPPVTDPPATAPPATEPPGTEPPVTDPPATAPPATDPPSTEPPVTGDCADPDARRESTLRRPGARQLAPTGGFRSRRGRHQACLDRPGDTDFDLTLQRWTGHHWRTVARADGDTSRERLVFSGPAGRYRYAVTSVHGSGDYVLAVNVP